MTLTRIRAASLIAVFVFAGCRPVRPEDEHRVTIPAVVETVGNDTYASFQPAFVTQIVLEGAIAEREQVQVWGVAGPVGDFTVEKLESTIRIRFPARVAVAEVLLLGVRAPKLTLGCTRGELVPSRPAHDSLEELGEFQVTYYWVEIEGDYESRPADTALLDDAGKELGRFPKEFVERIRVEGTGKLRDGRVINVTGKEGRFAAVRCPNGLGVGDYHLIPFRSVAVDPQVIPVGTELFIPAAVGAKLPDGTVHDGRFWAQDEGGAIRGKHLDLFTGPRDRSEFLEKAGVKNLKTTKVLRVKPR